MTEVTGSTREDLRVLVEIQQIDDEISVERRRQNDLMKELEVRRDAFESVRAKLQGSHERLLEFRKEVDRKNLTIKEKEGAIEKDKENLGKITSNKEYKAILTQVERDKADLSLVEDEVLSAMSHVDKVEQDVKTEESEVKVKESGLTEEEAKVQALISTSNQEIAELEEKKAELLSKVEAELRKTYIKLAAHGDGKAVVSSDGGMCGGCNMTLTSQTISELMSGSEIIRCKACGRILYLSDDKS